MVSVVLAGGFEGTDGGPLLLEDGFGGKTGTGFGVVGLLGLFCFEERIKSASLHIQTVLSLILDT